MCVCVCGMMEVFLQCVSGRLVKVWHTRTPAHFESSPVRTERADIPGVFVSKTAQRWTDFLFFHYDNEEKKSKSYPRKSEAHRHMWSLGWRRPGWGSPWGRPASDSEGFHWPPSSSSATVRARPSDSHTRTGWTGGYYERDRWNETKVSANQNTVLHVNAFRWKTKRGGERKGEQKRGKGRKGYRLFLFILWSTRETEDEEEKAELWKREREEKRLSVQFIHFPLVIIAFGCFCNAAHVIFIYAEPYLKWAEWQHRADIKLLWAS